MNLIERRRVESGAKRCANSDPRQYPGIGADPICSEPTIIGIVVDAAAQRVGECFGGVSKHLGVIREIVSRRVEGVGWRGWSSDRASAVDVVLVLFLVRGADREGSVGRKEESQTALDVATKPA